MKVRRWLPPLLCAGVILFVTSLPTGMVPQRLNPYDKVLHFTIYGFFAVLLTRDIAVAAGRWRAALLAVMIAAAFAVADELHQQLIPGRSAELADWVADSAGAVAGAVLYATYHQIRRMRTVSAA